MKYMGSKNRLSKELASIIQTYIDNSGYNKYLEPFVGGANMIDKIKCEHKFGSDNHKYLIALLQQTQKDVSVFPTTISKIEYDNVKQNYLDYPEWYVGLVGFCASYNGKYFGGYANNVKTKIGTIRNYTDEAIKNLIKQAPKLKDVKFNCCDFRKIKNIKRFVIYCDPPYKETTKYSTNNFPYEEFYNWCIEMSKNNIVLISEYNMPNNFKCIWEKQVTTSINYDRIANDDKNNRIEKLYIYEK